MRHVDANATGRLARHRTARAVPLLFQADARLFAQRGDSAPEEPARRRPPLVFSRDFMALGCCQTAPKVQRNGLGNKPNGSIRQCDIDATRVFAARPATHNR